MILLASASPRRRDLLEAAGVPFRIEVANVDESLTEVLSPERSAVLLARRKALAIAERHAGEDHWVVGADTLVALVTSDGFRFLGKPADPGEARGMLQSLSDTSHRVVTGVAVVRTRDALEQTASETTFVTMRTITPGEIAAYVASEEWRDKAGGYAIQENADAFVTRLEGGGFDNVVGLPVNRTLELLRALGAPGVAD